MQGDLGLVGAAKTRRDGKCSPPLAKENVQQKLIFGNGIGEIIKNGLSLTGEARDCQAGVIAKEFPNVNCLPCPTPTSDKSLFGKLQEPFVARA